MLRIVSRCSSVEEFVSVFRRFCDQTSLFIATKTPKPLGSDSRFNITLSDGKPMLVGAGKVVESHTGSDNNFGRPGMKIRFSDLDDQSRTVLDQLNEARNMGVPAPPPLPRHLRRPGTEQPIPPRSAELAAQAESAAEAESAKVAAAVAGPSEERLQGSEFILPANPFGELTDASLEAFIECTLYEETSTTSAEGKGEGAEGGEPKKPDSGEIPAWWPRGESAAGSPAGAGPGAPAPPAPGQPAPGEPQAAAAPRADQTPVPGSAPLWSAGDAGSQPMPAVPHPGVMMPTGGTSIRQRPKVPPWVIAVAIALPLGLLIGFLTWGSKDEPIGPGSTAPSRPAVTPPAPADAAPTAAPSTDGGVAVAADGDGGATAMAETADAGAEVGEEDGEEDELPVEPTAAGPAPTPTADQCGVDITINIEGATVYADGTKLGSAPYRGLVDCATKHIVAHRPRYEKMSQSVTLTAGETTEVALRMHRPKFALEITSSPSNATAYVGGRKVGTTPVKVSVQGYVTSTVKVAKKGYTTATSRVYAKKNPTRVRLTLKSTRKTRPRTKRTR